MGEHDGSDQPGGRESHAGDWFLPAILCEGHVRDSLDKVLNQLKRKHELVVQLRARLCTGDGNVDRLTNLGRQVKELENTLRFRLGMLQADRHQAWFREAPKRDFGPFRSAMLMAPVLAPYRVEDITAVKGALYDCWQAGRLGPIPFQEQKECLWSVLLKQRTQLETMAALEGAYVDLRLDQLPDGLPEDLDCRSLRGFLINVRGEFRIVRDRLNVCFDQLWAGCEKLWASQEQHKQQQQRMHQQERQQREHAQRKQEDAPPPNPGARRERGADRILGFDDYEALRIMGFKDLPAKEILKRRYFELAKKFHPDRQGGNEETFKMLTKAYARLSDLIE